MMAFLRYSAYSICSFVRTFCCVFDENAVGRLLTLDKAIQLTTAMEQIKPDIKCKQETWGHELIILIKAANRGGELLPTHNLF